MKIRYASLCSGISCESVAWLPLGWQPVFFAEIDPFACAVLKHHYPDVPNLGDIRKIDGREWRGKIDVLFAGPPCQSFQYPVIEKGFPMTGDYWPLNVRG